MNTDMQKVLALWLSGLMDHDAVVSWADAQIRASDEYDDLLAELSLKGPKRYCQQPAADFPRPPALPFLDQFALRADGLPLASTPAVEHFVRWLSSACIGEDIHIEEAKLGNQVMHLWEDCDDMDAAVALVRQKLPAFEAQSRARATPLRLASPP